MMMLILMLMLILMMMMMMSTMTHVIDTSYPARGTLDRVHTGWHVSALMQLRSKIIIPAKQPNSDV
eukprot:758039-Pyramimonas_sp.AAC.1